MKKFDHNNFIVYQLYCNKNKGWKNILIFKFVEKRKAIDCKFYITPNFKLKYFHWNIRFKSLFYFCKNNGHLDIGTFNNYLRIGF